MATEKDKQKQQAYRIMEVKKERAEKLLEECKEIAYKNGFDFEYWIKY